MASTSDEANRVALEQAGLSHVLPHLEGQAFDSLAALERLELLARLKTLGIEVLADRQKAASTIAKASRSSALDVAAPIRTPRTDIEPQGFSIWCHNTTLANGTQLDNEDPAPEFVILELERRTGIKRPPNAGTCSLHDLHLYFMAPRGDGAAS